MPGRFSNWLSLISRFLHSWYLPAGLIAVLLTGLLIWVLPTRIDQIISAERDQIWSLSEAPPRRQVLWEPAVELDNLLPDLAPQPKSKKAKEKAKPSGSFITPRLTDGGATLYFTYRRPKGDADIYRSRLFDGEWQPAQPVHELNTPSDEICSSIARDGRTVYLYSNRPGGRGGFDIWMSKRTKNGWSAPINLGPTVNSTVHEYDPAIAPDGKSLYFSSNRRLHKFGKKGKKKDDWSGTSRARPGMMQFDLYVCRRETAKKDWQAPEPLAELNRSDANEHSPYLSPSGRFLYFASDRPERTGEEPNLDIYRAHVVEAGFRNVENLGPGINTAGQETEPALSPEGFTLLFSSDREGDYVLYRSKAEEVYATTGWDDARWQIFLTWWWKVLAMLLAMALVAWLLWYFRVWLFQRATAGRFIAVSLLIHLAIVILLGWVQMAQSILEQVRAAEAEVPVAQPFQNESRQESYEQMAEPKEQISLQSLTRPVVAPQQIQTQVVKSYTPTLSNPVHVSRLPIPDPVRDLRPKPEPVKSAMPQLSKKSPLRPFQVAKAKPVRIELPEKITKPIPKPVDTGKVEPGRKTPVDFPEAKPQTPVPPQIPRKTRLSAVDVNPAGIAPPKNVTPSQIPRSPIKRKPTQMVPAAPAGEKVAIKSPLKPRKTSKLEAVGVKVPIPQKDKLESLPVEVVSKKSPRPFNLRLSIGNQSIEPAEANPNLEKTTTRPIDNPLKKAVLKKGPAPTEKIPPIDVGAIQIAGQIGPKETPLPDTNLLPARPKLEAFSSSLPLPKKSLNPIDLPILPAKKVQGLPKPNPGRPSLTPLTSNRLTKKVSGTMKMAAIPLGQPRAMFMLRDKTTRKEATKIFGGTKESEEAVERGLVWLAAHQDPDGKWSLHQFHRNCKHKKCRNAGSARSNTAGTGLALLPFLGAGHTHINGKHKETVAKAIKWLIKIQKKNGDLLSPGDNSHHHMYSHGLAAIALCEVYGMTQDPMLRGPAQKCIDFIAYAQHEGTGGWRYTPKQSGDTSVFGWQVMALKSAQLAGLKVPEETLKGARRWLKHSQHKNSGKFGYTGPATNRPEMTAQGLLALQLIGVDRKDPRVTAGANHLVQQHMPRSGRTSYYLYHATQVMYHLQGKHWDIWNPKIRELNVRTQIKTGPEGGSWRPRDNWENQGGRIMATSLRLLMLEVYYRHLPLYQQLQTVKN